MQNAKQSAATAATAASAAAARSVGNVTARVAARITARLTRLTVKRAVDLVLGSALLALAAPALAAGALFLALGTGCRPGGVLRRDRRVGLGGHVFELRSLRTRRLRLDVLSRLPHVVRGDLSLVGPAPLAPDDPRTREHGARDWRQELRPGLTGLAQVRTRPEMPWDEPALLDQHYAEHHRPWSDLAILTRAAIIPPRSALRGLGGLTGRGKADLSDADHRPPGYSTAE